MQERARFQGRPSLLITNPYSMLQLNSTDTFLSPLGDDHSAPVYYPSNLSARNKPSLLSPVIGINNRPQIGRPSIFLPVPSEASTNNRSATNLRVNLQSLNNLNQSLQPKSTHLMNNSGSGASTKRPSILLPALHPNELAQHASERRLTTSSSNIGEIKLLQYFERQSAAIEKLTERVKKQENKERADTERGLSSSKNHKNPEKVILSSRSRFDTKRVESSEETDSEDDSGSEEELSDVREGIRQKSPKSQANALEALGRLYLMGKLASPKNKNERGPRSSILAILQNQLSDKESNVTSRQEHQEENDDISTKKRSKTKKSSKKEEPRANNETLKPEKSEEHNQKIQPRQRKYLKERRSRIDSNDHVDSSKNKSKNDSSIIMDKKEETNEPTKEHVRSNKPLRSTIQIKINPNVEAKKKKVDKRKLMIRAKIGAFLWFAAYLQILPKELETKMKSRNDDIQLAFSSCLSQNLNYAQEYFVSAGEKFLRELVLESKSMALYSPKKPIIDKILDVRVNFILTNLKGLFDKLILKLSQNSLKESFIYFLISMSEEGFMLPRNFMFEFEIKRLQFTSYGVLSHMNGFRSKMIIGSFMLLRILIHKIILRPWEVFPDIKSKKVNKENLLTIGSLLNHIVQSLIRKTAAIQPNNQIFLSSHHKVKPSSELLRAIDEYDVDEEFYQNKKEKDFEKETEAISNLISQDQLRSFFVDRRKLADELRAVVEGWFDKVYEVTHSTYLGMSKDQLKNLYKTLGNVESNASQQ